MFGLKKVSLTLFFLCLFIGAFCQQRRSFEPPKLSTGEEIDILLEQSRLQRTAGLISLLGGPVMGTAGVLLLKKYRNTDVNALNAGTLLITAGAGSMISGLVLLNLASEKKEKARVLLANQRTSYLGRLIEGPALSLSISF